MIAFGYATVIARDGLRGIVKLEELERSETILLELDDGRRLMVPVSSLEKQPDETYRIDIGEEVFGTPSAEAIDRRPTEERVTIPVVVEEAVVGKRMVDTARVRVVKRVEEHEEMIEETLRSEEVEVERVPIGEIVDEMPRTRNEGDTIVIPVVEEILVVEKRLRLKEEIRITRRQIETTERLPVTLRSEEIEVERTPISPPTIDPVDRQNDRNV